MKGFLFRTFMVIVRYGGYWITALVTWFIVTGHFLFIPSRVKTSVNFYRALFPGKSRLARLRMAWRQYHNFSKLYLDRFFFSGSGDVICDSEGWERLEEAVASGAGGIILMSHIGNWESAARLLSDRGLPLMLFMGAKQKEQLEKNQKEKLMERGLTIVAVREDRDDPYAAIEGIRFLRKGGLVSLTGDRFWGSGGRSVTVEFAGHRVNLPEAPHMIALLSGAPLFFFFAFKLSKRKYLFQITDPYFVRAKSRGHREAAIRESAQRYAELLEKKARQRPLEWYHFEPFLGAKSQGSPSAE